ncbi:hypothetical protein GZL_04448 [Streptomyces sp. 769]|nr:hypothetical protein GZL_04448 [Streptomyces sp. 769]
MRQGEGLRRGLRLRHRWWPLPIPMPLRTDGVYGRRARRSTPMDGAALPRGPPP